MKKNKELKTPDPTAFAMGIFTDKISVTKRQEDFYDPKAELVGELERVRTVYKMFTDYRNLYGVLYVEGSIAFLQNLIADIEAKIETGGPEELENMLEILVRV